MADSGRLDEFKRKFDENPQRYFAPLANEYRKAGDPDRAIELCRTYLPQQPSHMSGHIVHGQALFDSGRGEEAAAVFKQALTLDPENVIALRYLGDIARAEGDSAGAMRWYGKVLELDPRNEEMANRITALASPSARKAPRNERIAPPTVRPEPEYDESAVALAQLVAEPDRPQPEIARPPVTAEAVDAQQEQAERNQAEQDQQREMHDVGGEHERPPVLVLEESFEIISWPAETSAHEQSVTAAAAEPVMDQSSELASQSSGDQEHDRRLETEARSFADFLPNESAPLSPVADSFFDVTSVVRLSTTDMGGADVERDDTSDAPAAGSPFVTETMAELYVQQGLAEDALVIYRELVLSRPDPRLHQRIAELEGRAGAQGAPEDQAEPASEVGAQADHSTAAEMVPGPPAAEAASPAAGGETVRQFFARICAARAQSHAHIAAENEGGLAALFGSSADDAADLDAAQSLAGAFGAVPPAAIPRD